MVRGAASWMSLCLWAAYLADPTGVVNAAQLPPSSLLEASDVVEAPHVRFVTLLEKAKASFTSANKTLSEAEVARSVPLGSVAAQHASAASALVPQALAGITEGIETLKRVRADVADSRGSLMRVDVKTQVLWDIDRMTADAERLHSASLAPLARTALVKALSLRFGVLLTPAFWTTPINRGLMEGGAGAGLVARPAGSTKVWASGPAAGTPAAMAAAVPPPA